MKRHALTTVLLLAAAGAQAAQEPARPYFVGSVGYAKADLSDVEDATGATSSRDDSAAFTAGLGVRVNEFIAFEANYLHVGKFQIENAVDEAHIKTRGPAFGLIGSLPLNAQTSLYLRVDGVHLRVDVDGENDRKWQPAIGAGIEHLIGDGLKLRGQVQYIDIKDVFDEEELDANLLTVSLGMLQEF